MDLRPLLYPRNFASSTLFRLSRILARLAVRLQPDGAGAVVVAIYADDAVMGSWHLGHSGYAAAASTLARAEADHLEGHVATLAEIDEMTKPNAPE